MKSNPTFHPSLVRIPGELEGERAIRFLQFVVIPHELLIYHYNITEYEIRAILTLCKDDELFDQWVKAATAYGYKSFMPRGGKREGSGKKAQVPGKPRSELFSRRVTVEEQSKLQALLDSMRNMKK